MRVAARTRTQSRRLGWGAGLVGAGLTATAAFGIAVGSVSAHAAPRATQACTSCKATPTPTTGCSSCQTKPPTSGCGCHMTPPPPPPICPSGSIAISVINPLTESVAIPGDGRFQLTVSSTTQGQVFSFNIPSSAHRSVVRVVVTGGTAGSAVTNYDSTTGFPDGIAAGGPLHAPVNSTGKYADISRIDFCVKPTKYH